MKKNRKNGGFTLVELVVILVILAILAAMLIPALTGYIDKANEKVVIAEARSLYIAAQAEIGEAYVNDDFAGGTIANDTADAVSHVLAEDVTALAELTGDFTYSVTWDDEGVITDVEYINHNYTATYATGSWTYEKTEAGD